MKRKKWHMLIVAALITSTTMQSFAAGWQMNGDNTWSWVQDDNKKLSNSWMQDTDGSWYYLDQNGIMQNGWIIDGSGYKYFLNSSVEQKNGSMVSGWKMIDNVWYFFNTLHDGTFGRALTGWQWIDGYSYCFADDGKMYTNIITPDGYMVDSNGAWTENGKAVYISGKGFITKSGPAGAASTTKSGSGVSSSGGGGGGGGGGGSNSTSAPTYSYTVNCVDSDTGAVLGTYSLTGKKGTILTFNYTFDGYELDSGNTNPELTSKNQMFTLYYKQLIHEKPEKDIYTYTIRYIDIDTGTVLKAITGSDKIDSTVKVDSLVIDGFEAAKDNVWDFKLSSDKMEKIIYYQKAVESKDIYSFVIKYICKDDNAELGYIKSKGEAGSKIILDFPDFKGYLLSKDQADNFMLNSENQIIEIYYKKETQEATPSQPEEKQYSYTVKCLDFNSNEQLAVFTGSGDVDSEIIPSYNIEGYEACEDYRFILDTDKMVFTMYYVKNQEAVKEVTYIIKCIDFITDEELAVIQKKAEIGDFITLDHEISGYKMEDTEPVQIISNNQIIEVYYTKIEDVKKYDFNIYQIDIDTKEELGIVTLSGAVGESVSTNCIELSGYRILGDIPDTVIINKNAVNNILNVYYQKETEYNPEVKDVQYTIEFVSSSDKTVHILGDITGTAKDGEELPVYFAKRVNLPDGSIWQAVDDSPKIFSIDALKINRFTVKYMNVGNEEENEDQLYQYNIKYVAEDTGAILGVNSGYATAGTILNYRNNFTGYGFKNDIHYYEVSNDENANDIEVMFKRTSFPGPDKNPITGEYDGSSWNILFIDSEGNSLLPSISGFTLKDNMLVIDYPDIIDFNDGEIYRTETKSPYMQVQNGTTYKQIVIRYTKGGTSDIKLESWKKTAQEAKMDFYKTTPYEYKIIYRERNSWNDIGLHIGLNSKNSLINIPTVNIDGYSAPESNLGSFILENNGLVKYVDYEKYTTGSSNQGKKVPYTISFKDEKGNDLFGSYSGRISALSDNATIDIPVYYPNQFTDNEGNLWEAETSSPQTFTIDALDTNGNKNTVYYKQTYKNPMTDMVVTKESEALTLFREFIIHTEDADKHEFYLIGEDYNPKDMITGDLQSTYGVNFYGNDIMDSFEIDDITYTICKITFKRSFSEEMCSHKWEITEITSGGCLVNGSETITCAKCEKSQSTILPAIGHQDSNYDTICDSCSARFFPNNLGDELIVNFDSGSLDIGTYKYKFICIDDNYNNTGKMLYICEDDMNSSVYGSYSVNGLVDFETSDLKNFLNEEFLDGLGNLKNALLNVDENRISILTKDQYNDYLADSTNKYEFPDGVFLTSTLNNAGDKIILSNGHEVTPEEVSSYAVRPIILLNKPDISETVNKTTWSIGDIQARTIGNQVYLFRCVSTNYKDKTNTSKKMALFLCESVLPADIVNNPSTDNFETLFFGENNNYKYSFINTWLQENSSDALFSLSKVNIGVDSSYSGKTTKYKYSQLNPNELVKTNFDTTQTMYSNLFIPSVEEALEFKDYLWKFENSEIENADTQIKQYCTGYWLRSPQTGTNDMIYAVNLHDGLLEPVNVNSTEGNDYSTIGIRPVFVMPQQE